MWRAYLLATVTKTPVCSTHAPPKGPGLLTLQERCPKFPWCDHHHFRIRRAKLHASPFDLPLGTGAAPRPYPFSEPEAQGSSSLYRKLAPEELSLEQLVTPLPWVGQLLSCATRFPIGNFTSQIETWTIWLKHTNTAFLINFK